MGTHAIMAVPVNFPDEPMSDEIPGRCRYFLSYNGVKLPLKLVAELEPAQTENRNTFFRGYFDERDRLTALQKVVYGEIELEHRYAYHDNAALSRAEIIDADGEAAVLEFDEQGQPLDG
jgi:hypothetical protein